MTSSDVIEEGGNGKGGSSVDKEEDGEEEEKEVSNIKEDVFEELRILKERLAEKEKVLKDQEFKIQIALNKLEEVSELKMKLKQKENELAEKENIIKEKDDQISEMIQRSSENMSSRLSWNEEPEEIPEPRENVTPPPCDCILKGFESCVIYKKSYCVCSDSCSFVKKYMVVPQES